MSQSSGEQPSSPAPGSGPSSQQPPGQAPQQAAQQTPQRPQQQGSGPAAPGAARGAAPMGKRAAFGWPSSGWTGAGSTAGGSSGGTSDVVRGRSRLPMRVIVGILSALLLFVVATHLEPAIKAGLRDGTHGTWIATSRTCVRKACTWQGKFVLPNGHVLLTSVQYSGKLPVSVHAGTSVPGLYPGGGLIFPTTGSDLWVSLLIAIGIALLGVWWSSHKLVADYFRRRREADSVSVRRIG